MRKDFRAFFTNLLLTFSYFSIKIMIIKNTLQRLCVRKGGFFPSGVKLNKGMGFKAPH